MSAPRLIWDAAGSPLHKYEEDEHRGVCATCGKDIDAGVKTERINNPTFANHAEFFKFGTHVCRACAWLYGDPKRTHRNVLAVGGKDPELWWPMISADSATEERPSWMELFSRLSEYPPETPMTGVLTTDPKPRMWPRCRLATVGAPGVYVHAPDYDVSEWRNLDLQTLSRITASVRTALLAGYSKTRIYGGLLSDYAKAKRDIGTAVALERELQSVRGSPEFVPALLVAQVSKEEKQETKEQMRGKEKHGEDRGKGTGLSGRSDGGGEACGEAREDEHRLF